MAECWKPIADYEGVYQVSDQGRVRRIAGGKGARAGHTLRPIPGPSGYLTVCLCQNGRKKTRTVHTLVAKAFLGPCPEGEEVNHKRGIKNDNRVTELEYVTKGENLKHNYDVLDRTPPRGETNGRAKLTDAIVREIRGLYAKGRATQTKLAKQYGVSSVVVWQVVHRRTWAHVA